MNDIARSNDPFESFMARRVEIVEIPGLPVIEIREAPLKDVKPIMDKVETMDPGEFGHRLMGLSLYVDGQQLTYERILNMTPNILKLLMPVMPAIFRVYGIEFKEEDPKDKESPPQKKVKQSSRSEPDPSLNSPSSSTKPSANSKET